MVLFFGLRLPSVERYLHVHDDSFGMKQVTNSVQDIRAVSVDVHDGDDDDGVVAREVVSPPQYFLLGFKDRSLEAEYLEYLVGVSKAKVILGLVVALLLFIVCFFIPNLFGIQGIQNYMALSRPVDNFHDFGMGIIILLTFVGGLCATLFIYSKKEKANKRVILYICEAVFLVYMVLQAWDMAFKNSDSGYKAATEYLFGLGWTGFWLLAYRLPPFIVLFFINISVLQVLEILFGILIAFFIAIPLVFDLWKDLSLESVALQISKNANLSDYCEIFVSQESCASSFRFFYLLPVVVTLATGLVLAIVSYFVDQSNRAAFVNKKVITVLAKQREETLLKQKEDQETLIFSIFPKQVAQELIASQSEDEKPSKHRRGSLRHLASLGGSVARLHHEVTILFTDIVGFTAMSQMCPPYQVMHFLHNLFVEFDDLIEMDSQLWKVETIGDAFMVASGLNVGIEDDDDESGHLKSLSSCVSCKKSDAPTAAKAALDFGMAALREARFHTMPNNEPCRIRVGAHTGEVCSGVIGNRMPRYCLFGDTVNTASRMESTGVINSIQVSETTHAVVTSGFGDDGFNWEERGSVDVKGKGAMMTYLLRSSG